MVLQQTGVGEGGCTRTLLYVLRSNCGVGGVSHRRQRISQVPLTPGKPRIPEGTQHGSRAKPRTQHTVTLSDACEHEYIHRDGEPDEHTYIHENRQTKKQTDRQAGTEEDKQTDRQAYAGRQADGQTHKHTRQYFLGKYLELQRHKVEISRIISGR